MPVRLVLPFATDQAHYEADACVVWCFDDRFYRLLKAFGKHEHVSHIDLVKVAGGAKALAGGGSPERDFVLAQIRASIDMHKAKRVILMVHRDCGAYGGSQAFANPQDESAHYESQLEAAKKFVMGEVQVPVGAYFADFDGLYAV
ncbi:MAG TPA: carbonic anhydrase [Candidatus Paceibacterota bacterium]|nr:carbonic anhydrase [Candidatus Paceibacterota bacterium]